MGANPHIVITGVGAVACLGRSADEIWRAVLAGAPGMGPMPALEQRPRAEKGGGQGAELPEGYHPRLSRAARYVRFVLEQALESAARPRVEPERVGVVLGTTLHGMRAGGEFLRAGDARRLRDFLGGSVMADAIDGLGVGGPAVTTCAACASGLSAVALGATLLRAGEADLVLAGGYDTVSEYAYAGFDSLGLIARGPVRPFSRDREGMKVAEGFGVVALERMEDAAARGAEALAHFAGFGESSDSFHLTQPDPKGAGAGAAIRIGLAGAGLEPAEIGMVSAHATATPDNDGAEYGALASVFGAALRDVPVTAFKSHLGHALGGAGAVELVLSVLALRDSRVPPTAGTEAPDPAFEGLRLVRGRPLERPIGATLNLSLGFGGSNACAVLTRGARSSPGPYLGEDVVITGVGVVLPGVQTPADLARVAKSGSPPVSGAVPEQQYAHLVNARRTRRMSEYARLTLAAAGAACRDAGLEPGSEAMARCSAILGTTQGATNYCEQYYGQIVREGLAGANPVLFAEGVPNAAAAHLSMMLGLRGGCQTIIGSRPAGLSALGLAALRIREGLWPRAIVGAAEEFSPLVNRAYAACGIGNDPAGIRAAAGAVAMVLESRGAAAARSARVLGRVGRVAWCSEPGAHASERVMEKLGGPARAASLGGAFAELFSVAPLAAMALGLMEPGGGRFAVLAREFRGAAIGVGVESAGG